MTHLTILVHRDKKLSNIAKSLLIDTAEYTGEIAYSDYIM